MARYSIDIEGASFVFLTNSADVALFVILVDC